MRLLYVVASAVLFCSVAIAQTKCGPWNPCPKDKPCCSLYGECGTGAYCLGACDFKHSYNESSCAPLPVCKDQHYTFEDTSSIVQQDEYDGDPDKYGWTTNGKVLSHKGKALLIMEKESFGTVITSTRAIWYGKVSAKLKTSHGPGVVSAFILMSGSKDEIDYEFVGSDLDHAQTNYYYQGVLNHTNSEKIGVSNTYDNYHTYEIDWQPEAIHWSIDGTAVRTLKREDTYNETTKSYHFPQTPSSIYLSLWPGGSSKNGEGTVQWAGGPIDWSMKELVEKPGYLWAAIDSISIKCYDSPKIPDDLDADNAYIFTSKSGTEKDVDYVQTHRKIEPAPKSQKNSTNAPDDKEFKANLEGDPFHGAKKKEKEKERDRSNENKKGFKNNEKSKQTVEKSMATTYQQSSLLALNILVIALLLIY
ncbi:hypothetical protein TRICI_000157 [Trichomonascus ciferrii]|uniref:GH16 domain-containing protein n=1 Tax=Trichomonascus ciferrii TaxID=44093 RepID=A0A642VEA5_9ASCO|nr:hypothetical protein TRICI_000157 [Trichomonascus ciferrii]